MGTLQKEENSAVNTSPTTDCHMENSNEELVEKEQLTVDTSDLMVTSSIPLLEDNAISSNSDVNHTEKDKFLLVDNQNNAKEILDCNLKQNEEVIDKKEEPYLLSEDNVENLEKPEKNESLITEDNIVATEVLPVSSGESLKDISSSENVSTEAVDSVDIFTSMSNNENIYDENLNNTCDVTTNSINNDENICNEIEKCVFRENTMMNLERPTENEVVEEVVTQEIVAEEIVTEEVITEEVITEEVVAEDVVAEVVVAEEVVPEEVAEEVVSEEVAEEVVIEEVIRTEIEISGDSKLDSKDVGVICVDHREELSNLPNKKPLEKSILKIQENITGEEVSDNSDVSVNDLHHSGCQSNVNNTYSHFNEELKITVPFPVNSAPEKENFAVEEFKNLSNDITNISENLSDHKEELSDLPEVLSEKSVLHEFTDSERISENIEEVPSLKPIIEDKSLIVESTTKDIDLLNNFEIDSSDKIKNAQISEVSAEIPCSNSSLQNVVSSPEEKVDKNQKSKKCPKLKLSFKKPDGDSPNSLKNWFVSESNDNEIKSTMSSKNLNAKSVDESSMISEEISVSDSFKLKDNHSESHETVDKSNIKTDNNDTSENGASPNTEISDIVLPKETGNDTLCISVNENNLSGEKSLSEIDITSLGDQPVAKKGAFSKDVSLPDSEKLSIDENETISGNLSSSNLKTAPEPVLTESKKTDDIGSIVVKEEPIDIEEYTEPELKDSITSLPQTTIKTETVEGKKKRGRPRKSVDNGNKSSDYDKVDVTLDGKSSSVTPEMKKEMITPKREPKSTPAPHSSGKKIKCTPTSTPLSGRKKNYDPELVCVPFSMGWMREHVIRATGKDNKRQSDIYYFSPEGTKLRSMPDIMTYLSKHPHIKLSAVNFTFAKELIFREPFEIERDAKQPTKKLCPTPKKTPVKMPSKALLSPADNMNEVSPSVESKNKKAVKRKSSSLNEADSIDKKDVALNISRASKKPNQNSETETLKINTQTKDKSARPSRKIVKKVPFDNSLESLPSKRVKSDTVGIKNVSESIKNHEPKEKESLVLKIPIKSSSSNIIKETEPENSESSSAEMKKSDSSVNKPTDSPEKKSGSSRKPSTTSENISTESLLSRTNIKSPVIKNRLKVKLGQRKSELVLLHKPCTKYCNFAYIRLPTVQCCVCLCLFHPECIPFKPSGLTKYCCVPCVQTKINSSDEPVDLLLPIDLDIGTLYPSVTMQILEDPQFDATYNKFHFPVDRSFVYSNEANNTTRQQPLQSHGVNNMAYYVDKNYLHGPIPRQNSTIWYPPVSFNAANVLRSSFQSVPRNQVLNQRLSNVNSQNASAANHGSYRHMQQRIRNPGSLPLLQSFSNAFFIQNQPFSEISLDSSVNFQNSVNQPAMNNTPSMNAVTNTDNSKVRRIFIRKLPNNQHVTEANNMSVLQSMLQASNILPDLTNKSIKIIKFHDFPVPQRNDKAVPCSLPSNVAFDTSSTSSVQQTSKVISDESDRSKRKTVDSNKTPKKLKSNKSVETQNSESSSLSHKNSNVHNLSEQLSASWNMNKFAQIYECLNFIFKFLNIKDLLQASSVCRSWNHLATQKLLWESVSFSGIVIKDWVKCCKALQKYGTKCIDFRGLCDQDSHDSWESFCKNVNRLSDVEELVFEKVPPFVIKKIADNLPQLKKLTCYCLTSNFTEPEIWSTPCEFELTTLRCLGRLEALKISSMGGILLKSNQSSLFPYLPNLTHVVLSGFKFNSCMNLECLSQMQQLITLELGDCIDIEPQIYALLAQLTSLQSLCLQNGGNTNDKKLPEALLKMNKLKTLELMNFQVSYHLSDALKKMYTLHHFSLWPDNRMKAKQVNFNSFRAATSCPHIKKLCWGILTNDDDAVPSTLELKDTDENETKVMSFQELFQSLVKHNPGVKVELKCLPRSAWSEFCSSRNFM